MDSSRRSNDGSPLEVEGSTAGATSHRDHGNLASAFACALTGDQEGLRSAIWALDTHQVMRLLMGAGRIQREGKRELRLRENDAIKSAH